MRKFTVLIVVFSIYQLNAFSQTTSLSQSILLSASISENPPKIVLSWNPDANVDGYCIFRKVEGASGWGTNPYFNPSITDSQYTDNAVVAGKLYEYYIFKYKSSTITGWGYILSGIKDSITADRGRMIMVIDSNYLDPLKTDISALEKDLISDGWQITRHYVNRNQSVVNVRKMIINDYNKLSNVQGVYILGHVPVPYSGVFALTTCPPDGHVVGNGNHTSAWPADVYYGAMNGVWSDTLTDTTSCISQDKNYPGDGKFDQTTIPGIVQLQVGRVDLYNMPLFSTSDTFLVKRYLTKNHSFKTGNVICERMGLIDDNFTTLNLTSSGWRAFCAMFGRNKIEDNVISGKDYLTDMMAGSYLWSCGAGAGSLNSCNGIGVSANFVSDSLQNVFTMLSGSFFGDWNNQNNLLRAPLASKSSTLVSFWGGIPQWILHSMAMGQNIGYCARITQNNTGTMLTNGTFNDYFSGDFNYSANEIHIALMGDPSLRMYYPKPVTNFHVTSINGGTQVKLQWVKSFDTTVIGYNIYRSDNLYDKFTKVNSSVIPDSTYNDLHPLNGNNVYIVRPVRIELTASGSYYNFGLGVFDSTAAVDYVEKKQLIADQFTVYPNPNNGNFNIKLNMFESTDVQISIYNTLGQTIKEMYLKANQGASEIMVNIPAKPAGLYSLKISYKDQVVIKNLVIQ